MKSKLGIIIFARYNSKRFKGKVLKKINNVSALEVIYERVLKAANKMPIIIATSKHKLDDKIVNFCKRKEISYFRGSNKNVLSRALCCCKKFKLNSFVRICADRLFLDYELLTKMIREFKKNKFEIITNVHPNTYPLGLACEIIKVSAFKKIKKNYFINSDKEHIFNYFYRNANDFKIKNFISKNNKTSLDVSLNTKKDFNFIKKIYKKFNYNFLVKTDSVLRTIN